MTIELSERDLQRYSRQIMPGGVGEQGQRKLRNSTVGVMGIGGLGCPASTYLAGAGVGKLILADHQVPDLTNLNRQTLHWEQDVGKRSKAESAAWKLREFNSDIEIVAHTVTVDGSNIGQVFQGADIILDCLDSFVPRQVLNEYCVNAVVPYVHAAVEGFHGQLTVVKPKESPCLSCLFPVPPPKKAAFPILGATAGVFGTMEAMEAVKVLTGTGEPLVSKLLIGDLEFQQWEVIDVCRAERCRVCSDG